MILPTPSQKTKFQKIKPGVKDFQNVSKNSQPKTSIRWKNEYTIFGCRQTSPPPVFLKFTHQLPFHGLPQSSPLMKLASLPKAKAKIAGTLIPSASVQNSSFFFLQYSQAAVTMPTKPPWKLMPPSQIF